jgi:hypothetical protein
MSERNDKNKNLQVYGLRNEFQTWLNHFLSSSSLAS